MCAFGKAESQIRMRGVASPSGRSSAYRRIAEIGARFGLLVFDEVYHLTAPDWAEIARLALAPFRMGLTATYDPRQSEQLNELFGPLSYWKPMRELSGTRLAPYEVIRSPVGTV